MSQQDNFSTGFVLGALLGGIAGGVLGVVLATKRSEASGLDEANSNGEAKDLRQAPKRRPLKVSTEQDMELARRSLEDKIAQLNHAIDDVRDRLSGVNGQAEFEPEHSSSEDP